jgi:hypothetical protein
MKLWQMVFAIVLIAVVLVLFRDPTGRVFVIVFVTGLGEFVLGLAAVMALFQTVGALGEAKGLFDHFEALAATTGVLAVGSGGMSGLFFAGAWLVSILV